MVASTVSSVPEHPAARAVSARARATARRERAGLITGGNRRSGGDRDELGGVGLGARQADTRPKTSLRIGFTAASAAASSAIGTIATSIRL